MVWRNAALLCETHRLRENPQGRSRAVTDTDEDMGRILIIDNSHVKYGLAPEFVMWCAYFFPS